MRFSTKSGCRKVGVRREVVEVVSNKDGPMFSVIIPVRNMREHVAKAIESVLEQSYKNYELIVVDGDSTDGTKGVLEMFSDQLDVYISEPDTGQSNAINKGFRHAKGDYLSWLNADEEYLPDTLEKVAQVIVEASDIDFIYGDRLVVDLTNGTREINRYPRMHPKRYHLYWGRVLPTDASFWSRSAHKKTGVVNEEEFAHLAMDYEWFLRLSFNVRRWKKIEEPLSIFKQHPDRKTPNAEKSQVDRLWYSARRGVITRHRLSSANLFWGWCSAGLQARIQKRQFMLPRLATAAKILKK